MPVIPPIPTYRVVFPYVVQGFTHTSKFLLSVVASADPSGFDTVARAGHAGVGVSTVFAPFWNKIHALFDSAVCALGNAHLDHLIGTAWVPIYTEVNAVTVTGAGPIWLGAMETWSAYDTTHEKMKYILQETNIIPGFRMISYGSIAAAEQPLANALFNLGAGAVDVDPYSWWKSKKNNYVGSFVAEVRGTDKHFRRKRGIA